MNIAKLALLYCFVRQAYRVGNFSRDAWIEQFSLVHPGDYFYIKEAAELDGITNLSAYLSSPVLDILLRSYLSKDAQNPHEAFVQMVNGSLALDQAGFISRAFTDFTEAGQNIYDYYCDGAHIRALETWLESEFTPKEFGLFYFCVKDAYYANLNVYIAANAQKLDSVDRFGLLLHYYSLLGSDLAQAFCLYEAVSLANDRLIAHCLALLVSNSTRRAFSMLYNRTIDDFANQWGNHDYTSFLRIV